MKYRFHIDLRAQPPTDGFVPSGGEAPAPEPQVQVLPATEKLEELYRKLAAQVRAGTGSGDELRHAWARGGFRHLLLRPAATPDECVSELRLADDGNLVRRVYERMGGEVQSLDGLFSRGLSGLDTDESRFAAYPGYELRFARYSVDQGRLRKVRMGRAWFHPEQGRIVITAL